MKGFEFTISQGHDTLYISNRPRSGFVSFIIADKQPSLLDVKEKNVEFRFDVTNTDYIELVKRMGKKATEMEAETAPRKTVVMIREVPEEEAQPKKRKRTVKNAVDKRD